MELLLDSCVWGLAAVELREIGHDVVWAGDWEKDPGDLEILARAHRERRVLVTLDKDFGELSVVRNEPQRPAQVPNRPLRLQKDHSGLGSTAA